jgi:S-adenosylmethionine:tRNA ribosyltransferase-isomerase
MKLEELDYALDPASIATQPAEPRDSARMLVLHCAADRIEHRHVRDLPEYLQAGDSLVLNTTRVAPMRLRGRRRGDGRIVEGLILEFRGRTVAHALIHGAKRFKPGDVVELRGAGDALSFVAREGMGWMLESASGDPVIDIIERSGWTPLPPYILEARGERHVEHHPAIEAGGHGTGGSVGADAHRASTADDWADEEAVDAHDREAYQTIYAAMTDRPSCAAPTAGLHFTPRLLDALAGVGVRRIDVELQVGAGTFRTVDAADVAAHLMHSERCRLGAAAALALSQVHEGQRLVAIGTTSVRVLESLPRPLSAVMLEAAQGLVQRGRGQEVVHDFSTELFIRPGFEFKWVDVLMTNFHLPKSTLLALVGAIVGMDRLKRTYAEAQRLGYRFYSYGDAMLVLP